MHATWVVVADEAIARFLERPDDGGDLREVDQLTDPAARADRADLRRDAHGRRGSTVTASAGDDELHQEAALFARRVAERLAEAQQKQHHGALRVVAAPRFLGYLRKALPRQVSDAVVDELDKDLVRLDPRALTQQLFPPR